MSDKIKITDDELFAASPQQAGEVNKKIVLCEFGSAEEESSVQAIPLWWHCILLCPVVGVAGVIWACLQKKYKFTYQIPAAIVCVLTTLLPLLFFVNGAETNKNWKNSLAERAPKGVVIVAIEDKGFFRTDTGFGTGVVVSKRGSQALVLTNRHVVCKKNGRLASTIAVITADEKTLPTEVVALPRQSEVDMALLRVDNADCLEVLGDIGSFENLNTGDEVVAIGHPNGLAFTMTQGIVSGLRENMLIQSSASINPGNSGGPLLNSKGHNIGINTFFIRDTQGLNFAFRADFILKKSQWKYFKNINRLLSGVTVRK